MSPRLKKLIGTIGLLLWITLYALLTMRLAVGILPDANWLVTLIFYAVAGTLWIVPVGLTLPWMHRPALAKRARPSRQPSPAARATAWQAEAQRDLSAEALAKAEGGQPARELRPGKPLGAPPP
jgi:hypothetical protein